VEGGGQDRERGRQHHRRPDPLYETRADQHRRVACEPAGERGEREQRHAGDQDAAAAEQVGGAAAEQHEAAVGEQVTAQHPLQALHREVQVVPDRRQGDVDDRGVDKIEEPDHAEEGQGQLPLPRR
jgi:hypothetical protein